MLTSSAFGDVPIVQETAMPSKQSIIGDRYTFPAGIWNSVISVSHFWFGWVAEKSRLITLSTSGVIKGIYDLADNGPLLRLAVSLTTADEDLRTELMPVNIKNPLPELKQAIKYYSEKTGKRVTLEAALLSEKNTGVESAKKMIDFAKDLDVNINLIPWNPIETLPFKEPSASEAKNFISILERANINVTLRTRRGRKIGGACGQLGKTLINNK